MKVVCELSRWNSGCVWDRFASRSDRGRDTGRIVYRGIGDAAEMVEVRSTGPSIRNFPIAEVLSTQKFLAVAAGNMPCIPVLVLR